MTDAFDADAIRVWTARQIITRHEYRVLPISTGVPPPDDGHRYDCRRCGAKTRRRDRVCRSCKTKGETNG